MKKIIYALLFFSTIAFAALTESDRQEMVHKNILKDQNSGFENGKAAWTASGGTFAIANSGSNKLTGNASGTWDSSSSAQTLTSAAITIPNGLYGRSGLAQCKILTPSGTATHTINVYDGSNIIATATVTSSTVPIYAPVYFIFPSSGTVAIRIISIASNEPLIAIDDCYLGGAYTLTALSQAQFVGSAYFDTTASCTFTRTNTALGALSDTDCPGPTVSSNPGPGTIQTTDANAPIVTVNNLPPGIYEVGFEGDNAIGTGAQLAAVAINDGTSTLGQTAANNSTTSGHFSVKAFFTYTTTANKSFELYASSAANAFNIDLTASNQRLFFYIKKYPNVEEQAYTPDKLVNSWSGYHDGNCTWTTTSNTLVDPGADSTCTFTEISNHNFGTVTSYLSGSDKLPGIVFTPKRAGLYFVMATSTISDTVNSTPEARLSDTSGTVIDYTSSTSAITRYPIILQGLYNATSTAATTIRIEIDEPGAGTSSLSGFSSTAHAVSWTIYQIDQSVPAPVLMNGISTPFAGNMKHAVARLNCDSGSAITTNPGSWISSIGNVSAGACAVTIAAGIFSGTPLCSVSYASGAFSTGLIVGAEASSATAVAIDCEDDASNACTAYDVILTCDNPQ